MEELFICNTMILQTAQLLNSLSIYTSAMIKASITELKIQGSKLKLTSVAGFPLTRNLWFESGNGTKNWFIDLTASITGKTGSWLTENSL